MQKKIIAAINPDGIIGVDGTIPWNHPTDMKAFKRLTTGHVVVMGRLTWKSLGRPLPNRRNVVISSNSMPNGVESYHTLKDAISQIEHSEDQNKIIWFLGGYSIYKEAMKDCDSLNLTIVPDIVDISSAKNVTYFPWINPTVFRTIYSGYNNETKLHHVIMKK